MKRIFTILILFGAASVAASAQSALEQLRSMAGNVNVYIPPVGDPVCVGNCDDYSSSSSHSSHHSSSSSSGYSGFSELGSAAASAWFQAIEGYADTRAEMWAARQAAQERIKQQRAAKQKYSRTSYHKLKDYKPIDPNAGKTLPAGLGATGNLSVYAKYDRKGNPTYGIYNTAKKKWQRKPEYSALTIVGPNAAAATLKGKVGMIDPNTGEVRTDFTFDKYKGFHYPESAENTVIALGQTTPEGKEIWYIMQSDADGNYVQTGPVCSAISCTEDGTGRKMIYRTEDGRKVGMLNEKGEEVLPPAFDGLQYLKFTADDASCYQSRMIDEKGNNRFGVVDEYGRSLIPCVYDKIETPNDGKYGIKVEQNGKKGWYDIGGNEILPAGFDSLDMEHFWDGQRHRAYFRGTTTGSDGKQYTALFDTAGNLLTDFTTGWISSDAIKDKAAQLEEYRIY